MNDIFSSIFGGGGGIPGMFPPGANVRVFTHGNMPNGFDPFLVFMNKVRMVCLDFIQA